MGPRPRHHQLPSSASLASSCRCSLHSLQILAYVAVGFAIAMLLQLSSLNTPASPSSSHRRVLERSVFSEERAELWYERGMNTSSSSSSSQKGVQGSTSQLTLTERDGADSIAPSLWAAVGGDAAELRLGLVVPEVLSWSPRVILLHNFLSHKECDEIVKLASPQLAKSTVVNVQDGKSVLSDYRTSTGMFITNHQRRLPIFKAVERRIAAFTFVPIENGENIQVLRYEIGQYYRPHPDYFADKFNLNRGGQRVATVLMYLVQPEEGGETNFPEAAKGQQCSCGGEVKPGICVKSTKGNAVLFWNTDLAGKEDSATMHASCPVVRGSKWSATKWMRQHEFH